MEPPRPSPGDSSLPGCVVLVGAGPGAADLLTMRGAHWLRQADVVLYDYLANPALLAGASPRLPRTPRARTSLVPGPDQRTDRRGSSSRKMCRPTQRGGPNHLWLFGPRASGDHFGSDPFRDRAGSHGGFRGGGGNRARDHASGSGFRRCPGYRQGGP